MKAYTIKRRINFFDCDPAGIIFYSRVFDFAHSAYEQLIQTINKEEDYWDNKKYVVPIVKTEANYVNPIKYNDEIVINTRVSELKSSSFELSYNIEDEFGKLLCSIKTIHVFVDKQSWKKTNIPSNILEGLKRFSEM